MADNDRQIVAVRVRPLIEREIANGLPIHWQTSSVSVFREGTIDSSQFVFDRVIKADEDNTDVYNAIAKGIVRDSIKGINGTIFAYGQTGSGKTFTMMGSKMEYGLIAHAMTELFNLVKLAPERVFLISMSYTEIYNEEVNDLLTGEANLKIRENEHGEIYLAGCGQELIDKPEDVFAMMADGNKKRHIGATNMNERSSRSHAILTVFIESKLVDDKEDKAVLVSQLNFVDLAGSEKAGQTGAVGQRLKEGGHINGSLHTLSQCINKLAEKSPHIPYRDSKLTRMLQNSLGGNSRTAIVVNITPASVEETLSTLRFASRAKKVSSRPIVNEVVDPNTMTRRLEKRVKELEMQLAEKAQLDTESMHKIFKDMLTRTEKEREETLLKQRRMTWCPGKERNKRLPLLASNPHDDIKETSSLISNSAFSAFKRPSQSSHSFVEAKHPKLHLEVHEESVDCSIEGDSSVEKDDGDKEELRACRHQLKSAQDELGVANADLILARNKLEDTEFKLVTVSNELEIAQKDSQTSKAELAAVKDELDSTNTNLETTNADLVTTKHELETATEEIVATKKELELIKSALDTTRSELTTTKDQLQLAQVELIEGQGDIEKVRCELEKALSERQIDREALEVTNSELESFRIDFDRMKSQLKDAEVELESFKSSTEFDSLKLELELVNEELFSIKSKYESTSTETTSLRNELQTVKDSLSAAEKHQSSQAIQLHLARSQLDSAQLRILELEQQQEQDIDVGSLEVVHTARKNRELTEMLDIKQAEHTLYREEVESQADKVKSLESMVERLKNEKAGLAILLDNALDAETDETQDENVTCKRSLKDAKKGIARRDEQIASLERGYDNLQKEYNELIEYANLEKEVYSCRTPGQITEKRLKARLSEMETRYGEAQQDLKHYQATSERLASENNILRQTLGDAPLARIPSFSMHKGFGLSTLMEDSPDSSAIFKAANISMDSDGTLDGSLSVTQSCSSPKLQLDSSVSTATAVTAASSTATEVTAASSAAVTASPATTSHTSPHPPVLSTTADIGTNTDLDMKWFELDDTVLGVKVTGAVTNKTILAAEEPSFQPTPSKPVVNDSFVSDIAAELRTGLEMAYRAISDLQHKHEQNLLTIESKEAEVGRLNVTLTEMEASKQALLSRVADKQCGSCDATVLDCEHTLFVPTSDWQEAQLELETQLNKKQKEISELQSSLMRAEAEHVQQLEKLGAEHEFLLDAAKQHKMAPTADTEGEMQSSSAISKLQDEMMLAEATHVQQLEQLNVEHDHQLEALKTEHTTIVDTLRVECDVKLDLMEKESKEKLSEVQGDHTLQVEVLKAEHQEQLMKITSDYDSRIATSNSEQERRITEMESEYRQKIVTLEKDLSIAQSSDLDQRLRDTKAEYEQQLATLKFDHQQELSKVKSEHEEELSEVNRQYGSQCTHHTDLAKQLDDIKSRHKQELCALNSQHEQKLAAVSSNQESEIEKLQSSYQMKLDSLREEHLSEIAQEKEKNSIANEEHRKQLDEIKSEHEHYVKTIIEDHIQTLENVKVEHQHSLGTQQEEFDKKLHSLELEHTQRQKGLKAEYDRLIETANNENKQKTDAESHDKSVLAVECSTSAPIAVSANEREQIRKEAVRELKKSFAGQLVNVEKHRRDNINLQRTVANLKERLANPEGEVKSARRDAESYKNDSIRYHDELVQIDHKIQLFGEEYLGYDDWTIDSLTQGLRKHLSEELKVAASKEVEEMKSQIRSIGPPLPAPPPIEDRGELCSFMRKRQHAKIVQLESDKAGLECETMRLQKELKQIPKLQDELHSQKQRYHILNEEHKKLNDLFTRTEQELDHEREKLKLPSKSSASSDIHTQLLIKGLEQEKYSLTFKMKELENTLDQLRRKYVSLRRKYDQIANTSKLQHSSALLGGSTIESTTTTPALPPMAPSTSAVVNSPAPAKQLVEDINQTENCSPQ